MKERRIFRSSAHAPASLDVVAKIVQLVVPIARRVVDLGIRRAVGRIQPFRAVTKDLLDLFLCDRPVEGAALRLHTSNIVGQSMCDSPNPM